MTKPLSIKEHAQNIVKECERQEMIVRVIDELKRGDIQDLRLRKYISQDNHHNIEAYISDQTVGTDVMKRIQDFALSELETLTTHRDK